jgi:hypothetical protein
MGYSLSWAALKGGTLDMMCDATGLVSTGKFEEIAESEFVAAALPTFWYLFLWNGNEVPHEALSRLSAYGKVVSCYVEEHVTLSSASGWSGEKQLWRAEHYGGDKGKLHLETEGALPNEFESVRAKFFAQQESAGGAHADVDYIYEIPAELSRALTGFRHDQAMPGMGIQPYEVLEPPEDFKKQMAFQSAWSHIVRRVRNDAY